jgi:hypothetical protein
MKLANPKSKAIAKATQGNASAKALSKSLLYQPGKKNKKNHACFAKIKSANGHERNQGLTKKSCDRLVNDEGGRIKNMGDVSWGRCMGRDNELATPNSSN